MAGTDEIPIEIAPPDTLPDPVAPPKPVAAAVPSERHSPLWLVLGGIIAAVIGYLVAQVVPSTDSSARLAALQTAITALTTRQDELGTSFAGLSDAVANAADPVAPAEFVVRIDEMDTQVAEARHALEQLADRVAAVESRPADNGNSSAETLAAMANEIAALRATVDAAQGQNGVVGSDLATLLDQTRSDLKAASDQAQALKTQFDQSALRATGQAALLQIDAALKAGGSFDGALDDLAAGGVVVPDELRAVATGVTSLADLQAGFAEPARSALSLSLKSTGGDGAMQRLSAFVRNQVGARSLTARAGSDPDAVLSRAEAALGKGDLAVVLTELASLPEAGQAELADWVALAQSRIVAEALIATLSDSLGQ